MCDKLRMINCIFLALVLFSTKIFDMVQGSSCPGGWQRAGDVCLMFKRTAKVDWTSAEQNCQKLHDSTLVVIKEQHVYDEIHKYVDQTGQNFWVGAAKTTQSPKVFSWVDGTTLSTESTYWMKGEPSVYSSECVHMTETPRNQSYQWNGALDVDWCYRLKGYICERPSTEGKTNNPCANNWDLFGGRCVQVAREEKATWQDAKNRCVQDNARLFASGEDLQSLSNWIGSYGGWPLWVGAKRGEDQTFKWLSGSTVSKSAWLPSKPAVEECVQFFKDHDTNLTGLNDAVCDDSIGYICGKKVPSEQSQAGHQQDTRTLATSPLFISGWILAAILFLVIMTIGIIYCVRRRKDSVGPEHSTAPLDSSTDTASAPVSNNTPGPRKMPVVPVSSTLQYDDCEIRPHSYLELQRSGDYEHLYTYPTVQEIRHT